MKHFIITATYRVNTEGDDTIASTASMESVEAQRWQMFQQKFGIEPLELKVEEVK